MAGEFYAWLVSGYVLVQLSFHLIFYGRLLVEGLTLRWFPGKIIELSRPIKHDRDATVLDCRPRGTRHHSAAMKTKNIPLVLVAAIALASCQSTDTARVSGIDHGELASELSKPKVRFSKVKVTCKIVSAAKVEPASILTTRRSGTAEKVEQLPSMVIRRGRSASSKRPNEGIYPVAFDFPELAKPADNGSGFAITPANPTAFEARELGWTLELKADAKDGFIILNGTLTDRRMGEKIRAGGAPFQPITTQASDAIGRDVTVTLSDNIAARPSIITEEIPILIAANSGGTYRIYFDDARTRYAEITCAAD